MSGLFITMEGIEGCGKSTQSRMLADHLTAAGHEVLLTREPGGVPIAESIREILLDPAHGAMTHTTELFLYEAARAQHVEEFIRPALERGAIVVCDRFADSTTAYQGGGRNLSSQVIESLHEIATDGLKPDITFLFDLPAEEGIRRATRDSDADRLEQEAIEFHARVRQSFLEIANAEPGRFEVIDATQTPEEVFATVHQRIDATVSQR